jgi:hypothetical protein
MRLGGSGKTGRLGVGKTIGGAQSRGDSSTGTAAVNPVSQSNPAEGANGILRCAVFGGGASAGDGQEFLAGTGIASRGSLSRSSLSRSLASRRSRGSRLSARIISDSITRSLGPPIISRCSTLSRRIITSWRCRSRSKASTVPSRGSRALPLRGKRSRRRKVERKIMDNTPAAARNAIAAAAKVRLLLAKKLSFKPSIWWPIRRKERRRFVFVACSKPPCRCRLANINEIHQNTDSRKPRYRPGEEKLPGPSGWAGSAPRPMRPRVPE